MNKRWVKRAKKDSRWIVLAILTAVAIVVSSCFAIALITQKRALIANGVEVQAVITDVSLRGAMRGSPAMNSIDYSFNTEAGDTIQVTDHYIPSKSHNAFPENEPLSVTYLPSNPEKNEPTKTLHTLWYFYIFFPLYITTLLLLVMVIRRPVAHLLSHAHIKNIRKTKYGGLMLLVGYLFIVFALMAISTNLVYLIVRWVEHFAL